MTKQIASYIHIGSDLSHVDNPSPGKMGLSGQQFSFRELLKLR